MAKTHSSDRTGKVLYLLNRKLIYQRNPMAIICVIIKSVVLK